VKSLEPSIVRRLLIRAVNWVGDAVMSTPAIGAIRRHLPATEITLLASPLIAELFSPHEWVDKVIVYDREGRHSGGSGRLRLANELHRHRFDAVLIMPNSFDSALIPWLARIPERFGKSSDGRGFMLTHGYHPHKPSTAEHEVDYYLNLVGHFGIPTNCREIRLSVTNTEMQQAEQMLADKNISTDDFIIGINPGAAFGSAKRWYPDRFAEVANRLADMWAAKVVIFGGPKETDIAGQIEDYMGGKCLNLAGKTSMRELMALIKRCNFFVTNDSGPMHIAAAFGVPLVAIFGSTDHVGTGPLTNNAVIVRKSIDCAPCKLRECPKDHRCMAAIAAKDVIEAATALFHKNMKDSNNG